MLNKHVKIQGNTELANKIEKMVQEECIGKFNLYKALEYIRDYCINTYGEEFYNKNAEAISFLVENEYCNKERQQNPLFDKKQYNKDMDFNTLY